MRRTVGLEFSRPRGFPLLRLRWRHGDNPPEVYISTPRVRFRVAAHRSQIECVFVFWPSKRHGAGEAGPHVLRPGGLHKLTETFREYDYDGAVVGSGEWFENE